MTDRELKRRLNKLLIVAMFIVIILIGLVGYILGSRKAELSIYTNAEYTDNLQALGINEEEFKQYLAVFGNLVSDSQNETEKTLDMTIDFVTNLYSSYQVEASENGSKTYDAELINKISTELAGRYLSESMSVGERYTYQKERNAYIQNQSKQIPYCIKIDEISKNGEQIEVIYELVFVSSEHMAEYMTRKDIPQEVQKVKAVIMYNTDYQYAKYFVSKIENI